MRFDCKKGLSSQLRISLKVRRMGLGYSSAAVADAINLRLKEGSVSKADFHCYEVGQIEPPMDVFAAWANVLGLQFELVLVDPTADIETVECPTDRAELAHMANKLVDDDVGVARATLGALLNRS